MFRFGSKADIAHVSCDPLYAESGHNVLMLRSEQMPDIKILSTHAVQEVLRELGPMFERASGFSLKIDYDPANVLKRRIEGGTSFDVVIVTQPMIDELALQGKVRRETCTDIGRSGLGIAVRQGAAKPNITTVDAFRRSVLAARSLVRSKEGTSGLYFETLLDRLGIADAMRDKIVLGPSGRIAELVARGEAEMAVQQIPELLPVKGVQYVGPLPAELQLYTVFAAGVGSAAKDRAAAKAFVDTPSTVALFKANGLEPVLR
jgi:molybdate transport system substrate-binding protein